MSETKSLEELELLAANFDIDIDKHIAANVGNEEAIDELRDAKNQADELSMTLQRAIDHIKEAADDKS